MLKPKTFKPNTTNPKALKFNGRAHIDAMYDEDWARHSKAFLKENPRCYACGKKSEVTDHLVPHKGDENLFWKTDNYIPLCHSCHNRITSLFDFKHVAGKPINEKLKWLGWSRAKNELNFRVRVVHRER